MHRCHSREGSVPCAGGGITSQTEGGGAAGPGEGARVGGVSGNLGFPKRCVWSTVWTPALEDMLGVKKKKKITVNLRGYS